VDSNGTPPLPHLTLTHDNTPSHRIQIAGPAITRTRPPT